MERMRPMTSAPRDGTAVLLWWGCPDFAPDVCRWDEQSKAWERGAGDTRAWADDVFAGWTPIVRPLEPDAPEPKQAQKPRCGVCGDTGVIRADDRAVCCRCPSPCKKCSDRSAYRALPGCECFCHQTAPEPEAQTMPPMPQRLRLQIQSAAQESVALGQPLAQFQALAGVAHAQATRRAARVGR